MSIDEIIRELESVAQMFDSMRYRYPESGESGAVAAIREAIALLADHPDHQPNEPLTEAELRCMVGEWVWVTVHYAHSDTSGWALVCSWTKLGYLDQMLDIKDFGIKFVARRWPPRAVKQKLSTTGGSLGRWKDHE